MTLMRSDETETPKALPLTVDCAYAARGPSAARTQGVAQTITSVETRRRMGVAMSGFSVRGSQGEVARGYQTWGAEMPRRGEGG